MLLGSTGWPLASVGFGEITCPGWCGSGCVPGMVGGGGAGATAGSVGAFISLSVMPSLAKSSLRSGAAGTLPSVIG